MAALRPITRREPTGIYAGYLRVSTSKQDLSPGAQRHLIMTKSVLMGEPDVQLFEERESAKTVSDRPVLTDLLDLLDMGSFDGLIVAKLDRLTRSTKDFIDLVERSQANGWALVIVDLDLDTSSATGEMIATFISAIAQWERKIISERTLAALQAKKAAGWKPGTPKTTAPETVARIVALHQQGKSSRAIAAQLQAEGIRTVSGRERWASSTVAAIVRAGSRSQG